MTLGAQERQLLDSMASASQPEAGPLEVATLRERYAALAQLVPQGPEVVTGDRTVPGPAGPVPVRIYTPPTTEPVGVLVYLHGGGWTIGDLDTHDHPCRTLCQDGSVVVVSVDYRLAPEHPYPAALDDARAALDWVAGHTVELGVPGGPIAVGGDSGGGNLAAVLALIARDEGGPDLGFQLLVYPAVDLRTDSIERYPSLRENASGYLLTLEHMELFIANYRPDPALGEDWRVSPLLAPDHSGLPPALVITAGFDPLRDEGTAYAEALVAAGVEVVHRHHPETVHTMWQLAPFLDTGRQALADAARLLRETLTR